MPTLQKTVRLHRVQHQFCHSPALYRAFVGGRGSGKSFAACYDLIRRAKRGRTYLLAAPTYPMLFDSEFRTFTNLARELGVLGEVKASLVQAFEDIGGGAAFAEWGKANRTEFYQLWAKLLPTELKNADGETFKLKIVEEIVDADTSEDGATP